MYASVVVAALWALCLLTGPALVRPEVLTPPYFNLAEGRRITATATCGEGLQGPELYCKLVGANSERNVDYEGNLVIQGQVCDHCDPSRPDKAHPAEYAVDGQETWWQSPPLSRGMKYNEINLTIDLGQEFHVAYVVVKMGNSPRPGVWVLERSADHGQTYYPWQYFADNEADCESYFGKESVKRISSDDSVICDTSFSKIVPLENGEIFVKLLADRPSANNFFNSFALQEFTRATNVRFRLIRVKNLLGHLMPVARQDPTTTRRYFYSIKDVSIGGRCRCNGHADLCDITDPTDSYKLICRCQHNTCGHNCETCCPGFKQKAWSQSKYDKLFECEPCNCFGHSETCTYDEATDEKHLSIDIHGKYEGGGICQNCRDYTTGINCDKCVYGYYRPVGKALNETDVCQPCNCDFFYSTGNCSEGIGKCECKEAYASPNCDRCSEGYYGYPDCKPCDCFLNGTRGRQCENTGGQCPCKQNFGGKFCYQCADGFYNFPECKPCECNEIGSRNLVCDQKTGQCLCHSSYGNLSCDECNHGYYGFPNCFYCNCDAIGSLPEVCSKTSGQCMCKEGYAGPRCDKCLPGYNGYPDCKPCGCSERGSASSICDASGKCPCLPSFAGRTCEQCSPGYYQYPECKFCDCNSQGSIGVSCDNDGKCKCKPNFMGTRCDQCKEGLYNFPICEECNCNPAGVLSTFAGCGSLPLGELCQCKPRVQGRICDECRELYWNLQSTNPDGCQECDCFMPGVLSGVGVCNPKSGQCVCKPSATSRRCDECSEGFYSLNENSLFGCTECGCNVGGSVNEKCDKNTGQCFCQPRIVGRACTEPMQAHYFPTLHQFLYEAEDGRTPADTQVRYGFDDELFPEYSWKGYAVFSQLQSEIVYYLNIEKSSIYRILLKYANPNNETIMGKVIVSPELPNNVNDEQNSIVQFKPTKTPIFLTVAGATGSIPSPFVMNPGRWAVTIQIEKSLFVDYFVILPSEYYEGDILVDKVLNPCVIDNIEVGLCRHFDYPSISKFNQIKSTSAQTLNGDEPVDFIEDSKQLDVLGVPKLPIISETQPELQLVLSVPDPGHYVVLINYVTPSSIQTKAEIEIQMADKTNSGTAKLYACHHTTLCRQAAVDASGKVAIFDISELDTKVTLKGGKDHSRVGIESIVAIPLDKWSLDYINPNPSCIKKDGKCTLSLYPSPPDTKKVEFKSGNEERIATTAPKNIYNNNTILVTLDDEHSNISLVGKVPGPGDYVFIVHFYQPDFPTFELNALIQNGQTYEAVLPVKHCPSNSGCRSVVKQANGNTQFHLTEDFVLTLKGPNHKNVWLEYVYVVLAQEYSDSIIKEQPFDYTSLFITKCGQNHFYINTSTTGFCKEATFSLTTAYNSGALPCLCDSDGSLSYVCDPYGGQCQCRPNVIGRRCDACKTGYFGFPNCQSCDCPSVATCETTTGECICPPRVVGKKCDQCEPMTYGFDPIIGCEECKCDYFGVENGNLQCDLFNGSCECKQNVVGRTCDHCRFGHWSFPRCDLCNCDYRGTKPEICNQVTSECFCKDNVEGQACDLCKEGTFNIQEKNDEGCSKCFCSGKTNRCQSSNLYRSEIVEMENWSLKSVNLTTKLITIDSVELPLNKIDEGVIGVDLTPKEVQEKIVYFSAPKIYMGNQLKSYGGLLSYNIYYTSNLFGSAVSGPDIILYGHETYLYYFSLEQPASGIFFPSSVEIVEKNFVLPNGISTTREQILQVLQNLNAIYIRATYWEPTVTTRIANISLETAQEDYIPSKEIALSVEQCQCPSNYIGLSCEECADGFYRAPYGGFCIPCQCNGHSNTCDKVTGICDNCKHNTTGDHCEKCIVGYHGNATVGNPYDCLICACPLPLASNNFATGCEVSPDGNKISCDCIPGYFGARCESCNAGFYGSPETPGEVCKECQCSGNINTEDRGSCDSITGKCTRCLNNTFGESCQYCRPGFFGDAVNLKDCQACDCDTCGMDKCDNHNGQCVCHQNVEGEKCDRCAVNHYGFGSCKGCKPCDCALASEGSQCEENTGMCKCKPGVTGRTCDRCMPGFWNYTEEGCIKCGCNTEYSKKGFSCNPQTGQCECLPGVIGDTCDHCPHRWVLIQPGSELDQITGPGCFECDNCTHALLDVTDSLFAQLYPISKEFETVARGYFTVQRLTYINQTVSNLKPNITNLISSSSNSFPVDKSLMDFQDEITNINRKAKSTLSDALLLSSKGDMTLKHAIQVGSAMDQAVSQTRSAVTEVTNLAQNLQVGAGSQTDQSLNEAKVLLKNIKMTLPSLLDKYNEAEDALAKTLDLNLKMIQFASPLESPSKSLKSFKDKLQNFNQNILDVQNYTYIAKDKAGQTASINDANRESLLKHNERINSLIKLKDIANSAMESLTNTVKEAFEDLEKSRKAFAILGTENESMKAIKSKFDSAIEKEKSVIDELQRGLDLAKEHSDKLQSQAELMEYLVKNSTTASETAIAAANSYKNIQKEIEKALASAKNASTAADDTINKSKGLNERVALANENSTKLLQDVRTTLEQVQGGFEKLLKNSKDDFNKISNQKNQIIDRENEIIKLLDQITSDTPNIDSDTMEMALADDEKSRKLINDLSDLTDSLPNSLIASQELNKDSKNAQKDISQSNNQLDTTLSLLPNATEIVNRLKDKPETLKNEEQQMKSNLKSLKENIKKCREKANQIEVGVRLSRNSILELRNPENLAQQGINTIASLYFKTNQSDGLIMYLGNEVGTYQKTRKALNDDFMALQLQNGYLVLLMDVGSGLSTTVINKNLTNNLWYKVDIERTGKTVKLSVTDGEDNGSSPKTEAQSILPGDSYIFNLDKDRSKLFVGGLPASFKAQSGVAELSLDGQVEDLVIGTTPVGLWNYVDSSGVEAGVGRSRKVDILSYGFYGDGYVVLNSSSIKRSRSFIRFQIKTKAADGLIFLAFKDKDSFLSIELEGGSVAYKLNMGDGTMKYISKEKYNDDKWHIIEVTRDKKQSILKVDEKTIDQGAYPGSSSNLELADSMYFGGYGGDHGIDEVSKLNYDGCIQEVEIDKAYVNFNLNVYAYGMISGCPQKVATLVSFAEGSGGNVPWLKEFASDNLIQLILKFKTNHSDGLLVYGVDGSSVFSLKIESGMLKFKSGGTEVSSVQSTRYDDDQWHFVLAAHTNDYLSLLIDDYDNFKSENRPEAVRRFFKSDFYFGSVPSNIGAAAENVHPFVGCIDDVTFDGTKVNFADNANNILGVTIGKCTELTPKHQRGPKPTLLDDEDTTPAPAPPTTTTVAPIILTTKPPPDLCVLDANPPEDTTVNEENGFRFGNAVGSRLEFDPSTIKLNDDNNVVSVDVKTSSTNGVIFFAYHSESTDFVAIYLKEGKVHYHWSCNSVPSTIIAQFVINDGNWHSITWSISNADSQLTVDNVLIGYNDKEKCLVNTNSPFYFGGTNPVNYVRVIEAIAMNETFDGCLRRLNVQSKDIGTGRKIGVSKCSEKVEKGAFFYGNGGYIRLFEKFTVGKEMEISIDIKPRSIDGILMSMQSSKKNMLMLEMINGTITFSVDVGKGPISASFSPPSPYFLCNGQWHTIKVVKRKNAVKLSIDKGPWGPDQFGQVGTSSTIGNKPLYIGGNPLQRRNGQQKRYLGCIRNVEIIDHLSEKHVFEKFPIQMIQGNVTLSVCPTI